MAKVKRVKLSDKKLKKLNRVFMVEKVLFAITPLLGYFYLTLRSTDLSKLFSQQPSLIVVFILSMLSAYVAYLLNLSQKKLLDDSDRSFITMNLILLVASEVVTLNLFALFMLLYLFYLVLTDCKVDIKKVIKESTFKDWLSKGGGALIVFIVSLICCFISIRLYM